MITLSGFFNSSAQLHKPFLTPISNFNDHVLFVNIMHLILYFLWDMMKLNITRCFWHASSGRSISTLLPIQGLIKDCFLYIFWNKIKNHHTLKIFGANLLCILDSQAKKDRRCTTTQGGLMTRVHRMWRSHIGNYNSPPHACAIPENWPLYYDQHGHWAESPKLM